VSGHIQDLWYAAGPRGGKPRPTARHGNGRRWKARYIDPDGRERSKSFARKADAERFLTEIGHSKIAGSYLDPDAGRVTLRSRVPLWLDSLTCDATTRHHIEGRVNRHLLPKLGDKRLDVLVKSPSLIQAWVAGLPVGPAYAQQALADLASILDQAVTDSLIPRNPARAAGVRAPRVVRRDIMPWTRDQVDAVRAELPARYQAMIDAGAGLGLRQGEVFAVSLSEVDFLRRVVHVRHQVKLYLGKTRVLAPPKGGKPRDVPLPPSTAEALAAHIERFPPVEVILPWMVPGGKPRAEMMLFTGDRGGALVRNTFNQHVWVPARRAAGIPDGDDNTTGMHQLRHFYSASLLRGGVDIKRLSRYLGHHSAAFTLSVYGRFLPDDEEASLRQIEAALSTPTVAPSDTTGVSWKS
jgi:integrase